VAVAVAALYFLDASHRREIAALEDRAREREADIRRAAEDKLAAERAAIHRAAESRIAEERAEVERAAAAEIERLRTPRTIIQDPAPEPHPHPAVLLAQGRQKERAGEYQAAVRLYSRAARAGSGKAARRLGEIFGRGIEGVPRDHAESLKWYDAARTLGESIDLQAR
jgi:TPR repeat protein